MEPSNVISAAEFIQNRLYFTSLTQHPTSEMIQRDHFFTIDTELVYWNFFLDFGPLNIGQLYKFCRALNAKLIDPQLASKRIFFYSCAHPHKRANAGFLISAWSLLFNNCNADEAYRPLRGLQPPFVPFHDASPGPCSYNLNILDCLRGMEKARKYNFFDFSAFDLEEYESLEQVENGDMNWLVSNRFLAFAGPQQARQTICEGYHTLMVDDYIHYFKQKKVDLVVRLNKKYYDESRWTDNGIQFSDLYFTDGSPPPDLICQQFIQLCESHQTIAVHCKAGLGRTGTCIAAYLMKHYQFTASEIIGYIRVCRPGSIIGPQQNWLQDMEGKLWREGVDYYQKRNMTSPSDQNGSSGRSRDDDKSVRSLNSDFMVTRLDQSPLLPPPKASPLMSTNKKTISNNVISSAVPPSVSSSSSGRAQTTDRKVRSNKVAVATDNDVEGLTQGDYLLNARRGLAIQTHNNNHFGGGGGAGMAVTTVGPPASINIPKSNGSVSIRTQKLAASPLTASKAASSRSMSSKETNSTPPNDGRRKKPASPVERLADLFSWK